MTLQVSQQSAQPMTCFFAQLRAKNLSIYTCANAGDTVDVDFFGLVQANSPTRYNIGFYLDLSGGNALKGGVCYHGFLAPACPANGNAGCINVTGGAGPFYNAQNDPLNICGDVVSDYGNGVIQSLVDLPHDPLHFGNRFLRVPCVDKDNNGIIDIGTCISWDNNAGSGCTRWNDTYPSTPSKCRCGRIDIGLPLHPGGGGGGGGSPNVGPIIGYVFAAIIAAALLSFLGFFTFIIIRRRRKAKPAPVPEPEPEPAPAPIVKSAAPAPVVDKPKDWTQPGTRYIGFGQANIKVKWGADAPPSAPRGHDKYDRWSMAALQGGAPPSSAEPPMSPSSPPGGASDSGSGSGGISDVGRPSCCAMVFPCCFRSSKSSNLNEPLKDNKWESSSPTASSPGAASTSTDV